MTTLNGQLQTIGQILGALSNQQNVAGTVQPNNNMSAVLQFKGEISGIMKKQK